MNKRETRQESTAERLRRNMLAQAVGLVLAGFAGPALIDARADTTVSTAGGVGVDSSGTQTGVTIKLGSSQSTGVAAGSGDYIQFDAGRIESSAINAAQA
ncbi:MAG TPA: hypothetical protein VLC08_01355, partial [Chitinolyticbacter sp.]|nr:hypothetical protein [Chitinolyticbacter sp.]